MSISRTLRWLALLLIAAPLRGSGADAGWLHYGGDAGSSRYSTAAQITPANVGSLTVAWMHRTGEAERRGGAFARSSFQDTPILTPGGLIVCTPFNRILALDPATGAERWSFDPEIALAQPPGETPWGIIKYTCRGVAYWRGDGSAACAERIFFGTNDARLLAIDARTGRRCEGFGARGEVAVDAGRAQLFPGEFQLLSPPTVAGDLVVTGSAIADNHRSEGIRGTVRAYDARTGTLRWSFDPLPVDGEAAAAGWPEGSAASGHANVWSTISYDETSGLLFLPTSSPSPDFYGGLRPGDNRYANSVVALRADTGEVAWHYQTVHHDLWDYDVPSAPTLVELRHEGVPRRAVAQTTKQGFLFLLDALTGEPLFPVDERPVPQGAVAGETPSPTQPHPIVPPPLAPQGLKPEDAWGFTFLDRWDCRTKLEKLRAEGLFTPPSVEGTVNFPGSLGGANWGGAAYDPERGLLIVNTNRIAESATLIPRERVAEVPPNNRLQLQVGTPFAVQRQRLTSFLGAPCNPPPWGALTAVDLAAGRIAWEVPFGTLYKITGLRWQLGMANVGGPIVTAGGLAFIAASLDDFFRAFDVRSGEELWSYPLPATAPATPMTYEVDGVQYVVIVAGGHAWAPGTTFGDYVIAFSLGSAATPVAERAGAEPVRD